MDRYLVAVQEAAAAGKLLTQKEICERAGIHEQRVSEWRRSPRFRIGMRTALADGLRASAWLEAELASAGRAKRGNTRDWQLYLEHGGPTSWREAGASVASGAGPAVGGVNVFVGIPQREPFESLPQPRVLPAPPVVQTQGAVIP